MMSSISTTCATTGRRWGHRPSSARSVVSSHSTSQNVIARPSRYGIIMWKATMNVASERISPNEGCHTFR